MPEIIEIRKYADFIKKNLLNKKILNIKILNGRYKKHTPFKNYYKFKNNLPLTLSGVKTKGKLLYMIFTNHNINFYIISTLGLSGGWCYKNNYFRSKILFPSYSINDINKYNEYEINSYLKTALKHLNIEFITNNGSLYYFDVLSFGTMKCIIDYRELLNKLNTIGPDIMDNSTNLELFIYQITKKKNLDKCIGIVLLDQKIISGIGNYLRADLLYLSKINPFRKVKNLNNADLKIIFINSKKLIWSLYNIKKAQKMFPNEKIILPTDYNRSFFIYNQDTDIYGNKVQKNELFTGSQKRYIYYVGKIQK